MQFNSLDFFIYFPLVSIVYFLLIKITAKRFGNLFSGSFLLVASMYFYMCWKAKYIVLIGFSIIVTYLGSLVISYSKEMHRRIARITLAIVLILNLAVLFLFKYYGFFSDTVNYFTKNAVSLPIFRYALPAGISFYTFQALGYTIDVYRGDVEVEKNPFTYALFVCFFPQLVAGPIERSSNLLPQFYEIHKFDYDRMKKGLMLIGYGLFQKVVIADRMAVFVDSVYNSYTDVGGAMLALATVFFSFQIYCDFCSYSNIAIGAAEVLGFRLMKNFNAPYFATSVKDFWRRWHISLSTWFKDYLYIPLGGSRCSLWRTCLNNFIVFLISGLWHGAAATYVVWGAIHGIYQVIQTIYEKKIANKKKKADGYILKFLKIICTFILVNLAWVFFRASDLLQAIEILKKIFTNWQGTAVTLVRIEAMGLELRDLVVGVVSIAVLLLMDILSDKIDVRDYIMKKPLLCQWSIYVVMILTITILGYYGPEYSSVPFIYFQF